MICRFIHFCLVLVSLPVFAQNSYRFYTTADGLPSNQLYHIFCDSKGFIWVGHSRGLTRFDGNRFANFSSIDQNSEGLSDIREDRNGNIWCHNFGGQIFRIRNNTLQLFEKYKWRDQQVFPGIRISENNELVATHSKGLYIYSIDQDRDTIISPSGKPVGLQSVVLSKYQGKIICIVGDSLYRVENLRFKPLIKKESFDFHFSRHSIVLGSFRDSLFLLSGNRQTISVVLIKGDTCLPIRQFSAPNDAFFVLNPKKEEGWITAKNTMYSITNPEQKMDSLGITGLVWDKEGNEWFSTLQNGLARINRGNVKNEATGMQLPNTELVKSITVWKNLLAVATSMGKLYLLNHSGKLVKQANSPRNINLESLHVTGDSILIAGSNHLLKFNPANGKLESGPQTASVKDISTDDSGNTYVANTYSLLKIGPDGKVNELRSKRCWTAEYATFNQTVYSSFSDGLFYFKNGETHQLTIKGQSLFPTSIAANKQYVLVGTVNNGIYLFSNNVLIKHLNTNNDLLNDHIIRVKFFNDKAWILSDKNIDVWDLKTWKIIHYPFGDNPVLTGVSDFTFWNEKLVFANGNRLELLTLPIQESTVLPKAFIDYVIINKSDTIIRQDPIFRYNQNNINFIIGGISYSSGRDLRFEYQLAGADSNWVRVPSSQHIISFPLLQPGSYRFRMRAIASNGEKGHLLEYPFAILKPWWLRTWFIIFVTSAAAFLIYLLTAIRIRNIRQKNLLLLEKLNLQSKWRDSMLAAIRSQMNPHFIFNALNTIQSYIYANDENMASNYLGKFSDLIRRILDYSQKKEISLASEIEMLRLYTDLEIIRFENTMEAHIFVDNGLHPDNIFLPPMMVQPYVENAIKHGLLHKTSNRILNIRFLNHKESNQLIIEIEDNGIGRKESGAINKFRKKTHSSFSTMANQQRLEILNLAFEHKISIETIDKMDAHQKPTGTKVVLKIPLQN